MAIKCTIRLTVVDAWHPPGEPTKDFVCMTIDEPLPSVWGPAPGLCGLMGLGDIFERSRYFDTGKHYLIIGCTAGKTIGEYLVFEVRITTETGQVLKTARTSSVDDQTFYVVGFGVNDSDPGIDGSIAPGETPTIQTSGSSPTEPGWPFDPNLLKDLMNTMVYMMMMMMVMQVMSSMMGAMSSAMAGIF